MFTKNRSYDDALLNDYINGFWGYGDLSAKHWFIGMEEGGGDTFDEVQQRLEQWDKRGRHLCEDLYDYHIDINVPKWFQKKAPLQATWNKLIRTLLSYKGNNPDKEDVRTYQISVSSVEERDYKLGEMQSILLPLPYCL